LSGQKMRVRDLILITEQRSALIVTENYITRISDARNVQHDSGQDAQT
jgi:hypothetical protein